MRNNQPVTDQEYPLPSRRPLVSMTDRKGVILHANQAFISASGFDREELIGQPHNIIRHPDMPSEAFEDMWRTLEADHPWHGVVKNRRKNGDYYWVDAYVTPVFERGQKTGYMSVRSQPEPQQVADAASLYLAVRQRRASLPATRYPHDVPLLVRLLLLALLPVSSFGVALWLGESQGWIAALAGAMLAIGLGLWTWSGILSPLSRIGDALGRIAAGDLRFELKTRAAGEFARLLLGMQSMKVNLRAMFADMLGIAGDIETQSLALGNQVGTATQRIQQGANSIGTMTAAIEQMSASVSEISLATRHSAEHAKLTAEQVDRGVQQIVATQAASQGVVARMNNAQQQIAELGAEVASIRQLADTIKEIADQTNLLALNAAIEAARAGESGRGFAVVADEVRKLAERTSGSTVEIAATVARIGTCTANTLSAMTTAASEVELSNTMLNECRQTYETIQDSADDIQISSRNIAAMLQQQERAASEVAGHIERIGQLVAQNSSSVEAISKSASTLGDTAHQLHYMTSRFERSL
ncbi:methyl-accepting chemotaxis protein [Vogesella alkaliphila]|uniref:Aerotaxis receptor Aer n=1 Tax=Vogesella alkaliphila TaxID=1193621 RepID=A0ABQ2YS18_9NEIS|nr:PAS domain-containing methyl-accepting chemotaxis protein [Vogesella alkaliphila]GGX90598.1 aerotaxis receptor Aer [Vogesella alkaliphila]